MGKLCVCVCLASWFTAHLQPDQLHLSVLHLGLLVRLYFKGILFLAQNYLKTTDSGDI